MALAASLYDWRAPAAVTGTSSGLTGSKSMMRLPVTRWRMA